jgi:hypothetical protein
MQRPFGTDFSGTFALQLQKTGKGKAIPLLALTGP